MTNRKITKFEQLDKLTDALINDIIELSDEETIAEAKEQYGNSTEEINRLRGIITNALLSSAKAKLKDTKNQLNTYITGVKKNNIIQLSMNEKRNLIERFTLQDLELTKKLTLAARKGEGIQTENDIEGMLEDMLELGLIDEDGNPK